MTEKEKFESIYKFQQNGGMIVDTKLGKGKTKNCDFSHEGKIKVYLEDGRNALCKPENIDIIGYYD